MVPILEAAGLSKRYGKVQAVTDCTLTVPAGRVVGLVGPNGAGKSTLLQLTCGLIDPTSGTLKVLGEPPAVSPAQLAKVGFVAQDTPVYARLSIADHLRLGARLNPRWDAALAERRIKQLNLDPAQKAGQLSGGQRAQVALTLAAAKRPELIIFDEPVAALDPLARRVFLQNLMEFVAELSVGVILSSHLLGDLERVCDHMIILASSRVQLAGDVDDLLATHSRVIGTPGEFDDLPADIEVIQSDSTSRQATLIVRSSGPRPAALAGAEHIDLEDLVLAYMTRAANSSMTGAAPQPQEAHR